MRRLSPYEYVDVNSKYTCSSNLNVYNTIYGQSEVTFGIKLVKYAVQ